MSSINDNYTLPANASIINIKNTHNQFIQEVEDSTLYNLLKNPHFKYFYQDTKSLPFGWTPSINVLGDSFTVDDSELYSKLVFVNTTGATNQQIVQDITEQLEPSKKYTLVFDIESTDDCEISLTSTEGIILLSSDAVLSSASGAYKNYFCFQTEDVFSDVELTIKNTSNANNTITIKKLCLGKGAIEFLEGIAKDFFLESLKYSHDDLLDVPDEYSWKYTNDGINWNKLMTNGYAGNINAHTVDSFHASQTPGANTIPALDANANLKIESEFVLEKTNTDYLNIGRKDLDSTVISLEDSYIALNCKMGATDWERIDITAPASLFRFNRNGGPITAQWCTAGENPIVWEGPKTIWDSESDGHGSGSDMDMLDGWHLQQILDRFYTKEECDSRYIQFTHGSVVFNSNSTWTVPAGVTSIVVEIWGAGGGGSGITKGIYCSSSVCLPTDYIIGAGGGSGAYVRKTIAVTPGTTYNITIGSGGVAGTNYTNNSWGVPFPGFVWWMYEGTNGGNGGTTSFGDVLQVVGGHGGVAGDAWYSVGDFGINNCVAGKGAYQSGTAEYGTLVGTDALTVGNNGSLPADIDNPSSVGGAGGTGITYDGIVSGAGGRGSGSTGAQSGGAGKLRITF